jgi:hypothetical protein
LNSKAISEQKNMLEKTSTRKIFNRVKDDTSSLYVQRNSTSLSSRYTDNLSKISKMFEFDRELFTSRVYEKALRGSLKDAIGKVRREQEQPNIIVTKKEKNRNKIIEREISNHAWKRRREYHITLLGDQGCSHTFVKGMETAQLSELTYGERKMYQEMITKYILRVMEGMDMLLKNGDIGLDDTSKIHADVLSREIEEIQTNDRKISVEGVTAVQGLWKDSIKRFLDYEIYIPKSSP